MYNAIETFTNFYKNICNICFTMYLHHFVIQRIFFNKKFISDVCSKRISVLILSFIEKLTFILVQLLLFLKAILCQIKFYVKIIVLIFFTPLSYILHTVFLHVISGTILVNEKHFVKVLGVIGKIGNVELKNWIWFNFFLTW